MKLAKGGWVKQATRTLLHKLVESHLELSYSGRLQSIGAEEGGGLLGSWMLCPCEIFFLCVLNCVMC